MEEETLRFLPYFIPMEAEAKYLPVRIRREREAMDGREIYKFAARQVPVVVKEILEKAGKSVEEVDLFVLHQANRRIVEAIAKRLKQPIEKFPMDMMQNGNMSSASIPVLLDELKKAGKLQPGMKIVVAGFGAGLTWGGMYLEW